LHEVTKKDSNLLVFFPEFLPDGKHFIYSGELRGDIGSRGIYGASVEDMSQGGLPSRKLLDDLSSGLYTEGHVLFVRSRALMAIAFDPGKMQTEGDPFAIAEEASQSYSPPQIAASVANDGTLVYIANPPNPFDLQRIDRTGKQRTKIAIPGDSRAIAVSPDGRQATINRRTSGIRLVDLDRNSEVRLTEAAGSGLAVWSPDGNQIAFGANINSVGGIYRKAANGSGKEELWLETPGDVPRLAQWTREFLLYTVVDPSTRGDIWYLPNPGKPDSKPVKFLTGAASESQPQLSPDWALACVYLDRIRQERSVCPTVSRGRRLRQSFLLAAAVNRAGTKQGPNCTSPARSNEIVN
jgi:Tol biopolymer transport system component